MTPLTIKYIFRFPNRDEEEFLLQFDPVSLALLHEPPVSPPPWTRLVFQQCPHCPLTADISPDCPLAVSIADLMQRCEGVISHDQVHLTVITEERTILKNTTAQRAISSLLGLIIATCDCPHTTFLRPMARFHLPLASAEETIYRATSMYFLAQYFKQKKRMMVDFNLEELIKLYENIQKVNSSIARRIRHASTTDSSINAIVLLDVHAKAMPFVIDESLEEIRYLFEPFFLNRTSD